MGTITPQRFPLLLFLSIAILIHSTFAFAQSDVSIVAISPSANDVSEQVPPAPARISLFAWQGVSGSEYTIRFSITSEPSLVVGVGAEILTTTYDSSSDILTVVAKYSAEKILSDDNAVLPDNVFIIALDPGVDGSVLPSALVLAASEIKAKSTSRSQSCYGPGADPSLYEDTSGDFGEDDGLNDPEESSDAVKTVGLPKEAAGTFASTNTFYWCVVPPKGTTQGVGLRLLGKKNETARLALNLSPGLLDFMGDRISRDISASNIGIFSDESQVGVEIENSSDGASASMTLPLDSNSTKITLTGSSSVNSRINRKTRRTAKAQSEFSTSSTSLEQRTISLGVKEALTLSPDSLKIIGKKVLFSGFVDDLSLVGEFVEIIRIGGNQKCGLIINAVAVKGTVIARGEIKSNGSYNVQIPSSAVFNDNNKKSRLVARIPGESIRTSREISLSNRNRDLRQ